MEQDRPRDDGPAVSNSVYVDELRDDILAYVVRFIEAYGFSPTVREIAVWIERSPSTTLHHIHAMIKDGQLKGWPNTPRTLRPA